MISVVGKGLGCFLEVDYFTFEIGYAVIVGIYGEKGKIMF